MALNHEVQCSSYWGRYPRTMEEAFGHGHRYLTVEPPKSKACRLRVYAALVIVVITWFATRMYA